MKSLQGKVAIITGAGRKKGLGEAIARKFCEQGAAVVITDIGKPSGPNLPSENIGTTSELDEVGAIIRQQTGGNVLTMMCDVRSEDEIKRTIADTVAKLGRLDIVVNNAGIGYIMKSVLDYTADEWDLIQAVNLRGAFLFTKHGARQMIVQNQGKQPGDAGHGGRIINIASQAAKTGSPEIVAYTASKHGMIGLTRSSAVDLGKHGITVNAVCPNHVTTGLGAVQNLNRAKLNNVTVEQLLAERRNRIPMRRIGLPEDTAKACAFLASDDASYITGEGMNVSGGEEMH